MSIERRCRLLLLCHRMSQILLRIAYICLWLLKRKPAATPGQTRTGDTRIRNPLLYNRINPSPHVTISYVNN